MRRTGSSNRHAAPRSRILAAVVLALIAPRPSPVAAQNDPGAAPQATAAPPPPAAGAEKERPVVLDPVIVTATSLEERGHYVPYSISSLSGDELVRRKAFRTIPEALREVPGVLVQKTAHGQGSPFIRGFTGFRTLMLIDGIRLNNSVMRDGPNQYWSTVDLLTVDRLEVVKGPSSVLWGSDAVGGTVNALTRSRSPRADAPAPAEGEAPAKDWNGRLFYRYASAEDSHVGRAEVAATPTDALGILGGISYKDFGDLSGGRHVGEMPETGYQDIDGDFKARYRLHRDLELVLAAQAVDQDAVPRTHSTIYSQSWRGTTVGTDRRRELDQERILGYGQAHWTPEDVAWLSRLSVSLSYHQQNELEDRIRSNRARTRQGFEDGTYGVWIQAESPSPIGTLSYGVDYYRDEVDSFITSYAADGTVTGVGERGPVADDASYDLLGVYIQDSIRPIERLEIIVGGRFTWAHADANEVDPDPATAPDFGSIDEDWTAVVGSLRLLYELTSSWNLFGGVSQAFRAPNLSDLTRFDSARSGEIETPAPDLDPERFVTLEVGAKTHFEDLGLRASAAYYYTFIDDLIVRFPTGNIIDGSPEVTKDNSGDGFAQGVEVGLEWAFYRGLTAIATFAWIEGQVDEPTTTGEEETSALSRLQPATTLLGLRWDSEDRKAWVEATATIVRQQHRLATSDRSDTQRIPPGGTPGYTVYTLRGGVEVIDGLTAFAAVENLTDKDYRIHGSGQNESGTNAIIGVDWTF